MKFLLEGYTWPIFRLLTDASHSADGEAGADLRHLRDAQVPAHAAVAAQGHGGPEAHEVQNRVAETAAHDCTHGERRAEFDAGEDGQLAAAPRPAQHGNRAPQPHEGADGEGRARVVITPDGELRRAHQGIPSPSNYCLKRPSPEGVDGSIFR